MNKDKSKIITGLTSYIRNEVIPNITDNNFKFMLTAAMAAIDVNPSLVDLYLDNPLISSFMKDDEFDVDTIEKILTKAISECGTYVLTIPAVKFLMPHEQELTFTSSDISSLFKHIRGAN